MKNKVLSILNLTGIIIVIVGLVLNYKLAPYENLNFPFDLLCIGFFSIGFVIITNLIDDIIRNKIFVNIIMIIYPIVILINYLTDLFLSTIIGTESHDLFLKVFALTYPLSLLIIIAILINIKLQNKIFTLITFVIALLWVIVITYELTDFLYYRQYSAIYAEEPTNIWIFVLMMYIISTLAIFKYKDLRRIK